MHLERRKHGTRMKVYLSQSYRQAGRVLKKRVYLGEDVPAGELEKRRKAAEETLRTRVTAGRQLADPLKTVLTESELAELKTLQAKGAPLIAHLSEEDWKAFTESFTYDTNAIEGSTVAFKEVGDILERDKWPEKPKGDIAETYGVAKAVDFIRKTSEPFSVALILELHRIVFKNSKPFAGKFRPKGVEVVVGDALGNVVHRGAPSESVRSLLDELIAWYAANKKRYPPLVLAAVVHNQFENIHPFEDGNGRVGRLLLNYILLKHGLPPLNIELTHRREYYATLQAYEKNHDLRPTIELMLKEYRALKRLLKR